MSSSKSCHAFLSVAAGHLVFFRVFWVYQVNFEPLLEGTGRCGELPGLAPPASRQEKFLCAASRLISANTSCEPDVFLILVYFCLFFHMGISLSWSVDTRLGSFSDWSVLMEISFPHPSRAPLGMFTNISIHSVIFFYPHIRFPTLACFLLWSLLTVNCLSNLSISLFLTSQPVSSRLSLFCR